MKLNTWSANYYLGNEIWTIHACIHTSSKLNDGSQGKDLNVIRKSAVETLVTHSAAIKLKLSLKVGKQKVYHCRNKVTQQETYTW